VKDEIRERVAEVLIPHLENEDTDYGAVYEDAIGIANKILALFPDLSGVRVEVGHGCNICKCSDFCYMETNECKMYTVKSLSLLDFLNGEWTEGRIVKEMK
jgi:hypothetical protein